MIGDEYHSEEEEESKTVCMDVTVTEEEIEEKVCNCPDCKEIFKCYESCRIYVDRLVEAFPVGEPIHTEHGDLLPVMGGLIPKKVVDMYIGQLADRLRALNRHGLIRGCQYSRPIYHLDELEDERRMLHISILWNAGFSPMECTKEAVAFKIVIEKYVERKLQTMGLV